MLPVPGLQQARILLAGQMAGLDHPTKAQLLHALKGHVLAEAQLVGTYQKGR